MNRPPRQPAGHFLGPTTIRHRPLRPYPPAPDPPETLQRIRDATTLRDEPELVGPRWLADWKEVGDLLRSQQHALDIASAQLTRPSLKPEHRLQDLRRRARHTHVDLTREIFTMTIEIRRAQAGGRHIPPRVLIRLERLEMTLDGLT